MVGDGIDWDIHNLYREGNPETLTPYKVDGIIENMKLHGVLQG